MEIQISFHLRVHGLKNRAIERKLKKVLNDLGCRDRELSVLFTSDEYIAKLNSQYLGKKGPTNVLAFPMDNGPDPLVKTPMMGDVVISVDTAAREAKEFGESFEARVDRLLLHGILHLLGYDHERYDSDAETMEEEEERLVDLINKRDPGPKEGG